MRQASRLTAGLLYNSELYDSQLQLQYLRARWYDLSTGTFNRLDPFFGNLQDPQSLHKYAYVHGDPVQGVDPTGLFTLGGMLNSMMISAAISSISEPITRPALSYIARGLLPPTIWDFNALNLSAIVIGGEVNGGGSYYGVAAGLTSGVGFLVSPRTGESAAYLYLSGYFGLGSPNGAGFNASFKAGVVIGAKRADDYTKDFVNITFSWSALPKAFRRKVFQAMRIGIDKTLGELVLWSPRIGQRLGVLRLTRQLYNQARNLMVTVSWSPGTTLPMAITLELNKKIGKASTGEIAIGRTYYYRLSEENSRF